jgi:uncharacterized tellurite resistance protein B-like protein
LAALSQARKTKKQLVKETLLMTLARASSADTNVQAVEVATVQRVMREATGEEVSSADVRVAAQSELFETISLERALGKLHKDFSSEEKMLIVRSLADVIKSDLRISTLETDFFDQVAQALEITPSELAGLVPEDS